MGDSDNWENLIIGLIYWVGRFSGEGNVYPLQYICLENFMDREAWQATVHGLPELDTTLFFAGEIFSLLKR